MLDSYCMYSMWHLKNEESELFEIKLPVMRLVTVKPDTGLEQCGALNAACCVLVSDDWGGEECTVAWTRGNDKDIPVHSLIFSPFPHSSKVKSHCVSGCVWKVCASGLIVLMVFMDNFESKYISDKLDLYPALLYYSQKCCTHWNKVNF